MNRREVNLGLLATAGATLIEPASAQSSSSLRVNSKRISDHLSALSEFGKKPQGGVSRIAYSEADRQGREYVIGLMRAAKLDTSVDFAGNIIGRRAGSDRALPPLLFGSHSDSVPEGGNYDGDVGSLGAIEVAQVLAENNVLTRYPLQVVIFQNEEGGLKGSKAISGELTEQELELVSVSGKTIGEGIRFIGGDPSRLASVRRKRGDIAAYLELHIEQGGILEARKVDIGVVEGIVAGRQWDVTVEGVANHAGTTPPMDQRHDPLLAAAKFIEAVNRVVTSVPGRQVGTVGRIQALPGAPNVIPGKVILSVDLRDLDASKVDTLYRGILEEADAIARASGTRFDFKEISVIAPAPTDEAIRQIITESANELGLTTNLMPSGAGHDAESMARLGPVGMIFVPSVGGISHAPREFAKPEDIANGANVLLHTLLKLDRTL
jgi:N-carbamoyl-L-amino-acid hydrolase